MLAGKTLLVTGGTGSFGNAVINSFADSNIQEIRVFSRDEKKQEEMRNKYKNEKIRFYIGDIRDPGSVRSAMRGVDYVFHAAALKQVPSCEFYPLEACKTNVLGTENVLESAIVNRVRKVVVLSTDKAVYPINAMGISKALMEKITIAKSRESHETVMCITRYGNVMESRGSVIPLFIRQINSGMHLTVTDPNMTRFIMSLEEAVGLVRFAFENASPGEIYVQKSPACKVIDLARALLKIGGQPEDFFKIIGTRHGEKAHETLLSREEMRQCHELDMYYRINPDGRSLNYELYFERGDKVTTELQDFSSSNARQLNIEELVDLLSGLESVKLLTGH
jgi:UDP-N-acetylglucosamine 4,6-dehydratase